MPRRNGGLKRKDRGGLDDRTRELLTIGHDWDFLEGFERTAEQLRQVWKEHRVELLSAWILEKPETRPAGWWRFDAPKELRRRIGGTGTALAERPDGKHPLAFGEPNAYDSDYSTVDPPRFELERAYLLRHGLLTRAER